MTRSPQCLALAIAVLAHLTTGTASAAPEQVLALSDVSHIHGLAFDPSTPSDLLLATHTGLYRASPDGLATRVSPDSHDYMGFSVRPDGSLVSSGHPEGGGNLGFRASDDGGATWVLLSQGADGPVDFHAIAVSPEPDGPMIGLFRGGIQRSDDAGWTWQWMTAAPEQTLDLAIAPGKEGRVLAATISGLMQLDAAGVWQPVRSGVATMVDTGPDDRTFVYFAGEGLLVKSTGGNWTTMWSTAVDDPMLHLAVSPEDPGTMAAVTYTGRILLSKDGGSSWSAFGE